MTKIIWRYNYLIISKITAFLFGKDLEILYLYS